MKTQLGLSLSIFVFLSLFSVIFSAGANTVYEIYYDDGSGDGGLIGSSAQGMNVVNFTPPYTYNWLVSVRFCIEPVEDFYPSPLVLHVLNASFSDMITPITIPLASLQLDWNQIDLSSYNLVITDDFYIGLTIQPDAGWMLRVDSASVSGRSWWYEPAHMPPWIPVSGNAMIRASVEEVPGPVIPEIPYGTITSIIAMFIALGVFLVRRKYF